MNYLLDLTLIELHPSYYITPTPTFLLTHSFEQIPLQSKLQINNVDPVYKLNVKRSDLY